ncbi:FixH family protein [Methylosinus sp. Ce-a6]|uniref:FixH family protein n=1 Tax=Methylosinus sp. Ce-a6 TaxID=2172005 RepID=UPI001FCEBA01|nr:FixH family protein [Methylosinus sp. Ce-a6]
MRALVAALIGLAMAETATIARAEVKDYEFQLVNKEIKNGDAIVSVRLVHKPDGKLVPGAMTFATQLDMASDGMEDDEDHVVPALDHTVQQTNVWLKKLTDDHHLGDRHQCAAASGVRDEGRSLAIGFNMTTSTGSDKRKR